MHGHVKKIALMYLISVQQSGINSPLDYKNFSSSAKILHISL